MSTELKGQNGKTCGSALYFQDLNQNQLIGRLMNGMEFNGYYGALPNGKWHS